MRGGRFLFYLSSAFICGNLLTEHLSSSFSDWQLLLSSAILLLLAIIGLGVAIVLKSKSRVLYLALFFVIGSLLVAEDYSFAPKALKRNSLTENEFILKARSKFDERLQKVIPSEQTETYSVLKALSLGDKKDIPRELKKSFRQSGAMHLLALSGLHVGLLYGFLSFLLSFLGKGRRSRWIKSAVTIPLLWFYALFTGASPSICRAVIMATVYEIGGLAGRDNNGFNSLGISALIITILNPHAPSEISFQLSFSAMLGIFTIFPVLQKLIKDYTSNKIIVKIWETAALSIACQIFTTPLTMHYFGSFTLFSLLTNTLSIPITGVIMTLIPISLVCAGIPIAGDLSSTLLTWMISLLNFVIEIISQAL